MRPLPPHDRLRELVETAICLGVRRIGYYTNAERYPELAELRSADIAHIPTPTWAKVSKRRRGPVRLHPRTT